MHTFIPLFPLMTLFLKLNHDEVSVTLYSITVLL